MIIKTFQTYSKNTSFRWLFFGLLSVLLLIGIPWLDQQKQNPDKITQRFETVLLENEIHLRQEFNRITENFLRDSTTSLRPDQIASIPHPVYPELTLLIYQDDSLIYWSDNEVPYTFVSFPECDQTPSIIKLANGWYELSVMKRGMFTLVGLCLVKQEYPFENQYLRNSFTGKSRIPEMVKISLHEGLYNAYSAQGDFLCSLEIPASLPPRNDQGWLVFFLVFAYLFFIAFLNQWSRTLTSVFQKDHWLFFILIFDILFLRGVQFLLQWPSALYNSELFGPMLYSSSWLFPSLGDFFLNTMLILVIAFLYFRTYPSYHIPRKSNRWGDSLRLVVNCLYSLVALVLVMAGIKSLVIHSTLPMNLENISRLSWESIPAFASIGFLACSWILFTMRLTFPGKRVESPPGEITTRKIPVSRFFLAMVLFAGVATVVLNQANNQREKEQRELIAIRLAARQNPVTELLLNQSIQGITEDTSVCRFLRASGRNEVEQQQTDDSTSSYILIHYFPNYWNNFNIQITVCRPSKTLRIQPQGFIIECSAYFDDVIFSFGKRCHNEIYFLDYGYGNENYIVRHPIAGCEATLYIEISSRTTYRDLGYPELLVDRRTYDIPDLSDYSYAFYQDNHLVHRVGEYAYGFELTAYIDSVTGKLLPSTDRMDHFLYKINERESLLISRSNPSWLNVISPFSYLLIFLVLLFTTGYGILYFRELRTLTSFSLRNRLQLTMLGMIITLFIITGGLLMVYLTWLNSEKNEENLLERTLSILVEVEHKFDNLDDLQEAGSEELETLLIKFSNVFFSDINLYDPQGILLASSRPRIFQEGLISDLINRQAYRRLQEQRTSMFVQTEQIGELYYLSAYIPFYNTQNKLLGYLNLPYFSRQDDLKREISTFLIAFINIYVLFFLIGALVTYLVSNYITSPLKLLAFRIRRIRIGKTNDKLIWRREDEIGKLVEEYNRMLDELTISAEKLAVSERESAWREMAQQVAHEIKNPLTPMKLGVQYLQKAWEDRAEDWGLRLQRFSDAMIAQIDTLSAIASEFSYFARMPKPENETINLDDLIKTSLTIYKDVSEIRITFHPSIHQKWIIADRRQLLRVFSNLINNAIEAIEARPETHGKIEVKTNQEGRVNSVIISDNGKGIEPDKADKIFQPNFTTRSGGAGLGLAIVKEIVHSVGGTICFDSDPGKITTFTIRFPASSYPDSKEES
ncbi:MAG: GHKL domain-containing protein [Bacteroidales bacterium]|nr:GHKL domain-containing protein [Bacteroidales bacterium]